MILYMIILDVHRNGLSQTLSISSSLWYVDKIHWLMLFCMRKFLRHWMVCSLSGNCFCCKQTASGAAYKSEMRGMQPLNSFISPESLCNSICPSHIGGEDCISLQSRLQKTFHFQSYLTKEIVQIHNLFKFLLWC